jgi:hypothetical protein
MKPVHCKKLSGDRDFDCESELLAHFRALVERALKTGWAEEEVANALLSLAQLYSLDLLDDALIADPALPVLH